MQIHGRLLDQYEWILRSILTPLNDRSDKKSRLNSTFYVLSRIISVMKLLIRNVFIYEKNSVLNIAVTNDRNSEHPGRKKRRDLF